MNYIQTILLYFPVPIINTFGMSQLASIQGEYHMINLSSGRILDEIMSSYGNNPDTINTQIKVDFPRMDIYYNNIKCHTLEDLLLNIHLFPSIAALCTQAVYYYPYVTICNLTDEDNCHVTSGNDAPMVNIMYDDNILSIVFKKILYYKNIETDTLLATFHTFTTFIMGTGTCSICWIKQNENSAYL